MSASGDSSAAEKSKPEGSRKGRSQDPRRNRRSTSGEQPPKRRLFLLLTFLLLAAVTLFVTRAIFPRQSVEELFRQAVEATEKGDEQKAADLLDSVLAREPDHHEARLYRGQVARDLGDRLSAIGYWNSIPDTPARFGGVARYLEGTALLEADKAVAAEVLLRRSIELNPKYLQPHERLIELYVAQMRGQETRQQLDELRYLRPWKLEELVLYSIAGQRLQETDDAIARMERFVTADRNDIYSAVALVRYYLDGEKLAQAAELTTRLLAQVGNDNRILGLLAEIRIRQNDLTGAARAIGSIQKEKPVDAFFLRSCGNYWSARGDRERAAASLAQAVLADAEDLATQQRLGTELSRLGRQEEAVVHLHQAELIDRVLRQASRIPRRERENDKLLVPIVLDVASALEELKRYDESVHWFDQARLLDPNCEQALNGIRKIAKMIQENPSFVESVGGERRVDVALSGDMLRHLIPESIPTAAKVSGVASQTALHSIKLRDLHTEAGIEFQYFNGQTGLKYLVESMGGAVAVLDYDNDGWPDLYFAQGCALPYDEKRHEHLDRLFRNLGNGKFLDVTEAAGLGDARYGQGCVAGDYDNDGDTDLVVANFGENVFYKNNGDGTFDDVSLEVGLTGNKWSSSLAFADLDRDGYLDLYVVTYVDSLRVCHGQNGHVATCDPQNFGAEQDQLLRNRGDGTFEDVSKTSGILAPDGKGLGIVVADLDNDMWPDIYIANDGTPNFLFRNRGRDGSSMSFESYGMLSGTAVNGEGQAQGGMGIACADFHGKGLLDLYVTNFYLETNTMYRNRGQMYFDDTTLATKVKPATKPMVGFGVQAIDFDLDGRQDMVIGNGHIDDFRFRNEPWKMPPLLFQGFGDGTFRDVSRDAGQYFHGEYLGRGVARLDWDCDGDPDALIVHQDAPAALLSNETEKPGNRLVIELHGVESNRDAIGARLVITTDLGTQHLESIGGDGFFASNERKMIVGLGTAMQARSIEIIWPTGQQVRTDNVPGNSRMVVVEGRQPEITALAEGR